MIYVITHTYDGAEVKEFLHTEEAEEYCSKFEQESAARKNGDILLVVEGHKLKIKPVEVVSRVRLERE